MVGGGERDCGVPPQQTATHDRKGVFLRQKSSTHLVRVSLDGGVAQDEELGEVPWDVVGVARGRLEPREHRGGVQPVHVNLAGRTHVRFAARKCAIVTVVVDMEVKGGESRYQRNKRERGEAGGGGLVLGEETSTKHKRRIHNTQASNTALARENNGGMAPITGEQSRAGVALKGRPPLRKLDRWLTCSRPVVKMQCCVRSPELHHRSKTPCHVRLQPHQHLPPRRSHHTSVHDKIYTTPYTRCSPCRRLVGKKKTQGQGHPCALSASTPTARHVKPIHLMHRGMYPVPSPRTRRGTHGYIAPTVFNFLSIKEHNELISGID